MTRRAAWLPGALLLAAVTGAWAFVLAQAQAPPPGVVEVASRAIGFMRDLLGLDAAEPAAADPARVAAVLRLAGDTLVMSVLATGLAGIGAIVSLPFASQLLTEGRSGPARWAARALRALTRGGHVLARSVPEVVWALLVVFVVRPGVLAGALALALHEIGVLGRLGNDVTDDLDRAPLEALRSAGAGRWQLFAYGVAPQVLPQLVSFLLYRWEVVMRATAVVGFITGAGLGLQLRLDLAFRRWSDLGLVLAAYVALVWLAEFASARLRRLAR